MKNARLADANRDYILKHIPHISSLMVDSVDEVIQHADVIVIGNGADEFRAVADQMPSGKSIVDLVRAADRCSSSDESYDGICW